MFVTFEPHNHLLAKCLILDNEFLSKADKFFTIHERQFNEELSYSEKVPVPVINKDDQYIYCPINLVESFTKYLVNYGYFVDNSQIDLKYVPKFDIKQDWIDKFNNRPGQLDYFKKVVSSNRGVVQLPTGFGKSLFIVALVDSYIDDGNILIITPFNSIKEELSMRFSAIDIEVPTWFNINSRINIINAPGYHISNNYQSPECIEWMSKVKIIIIDECENIPDSMVDIFQQLKSIKYAYGMSASADKISGNLLEVGDNGLFNLTWSTYLIISYVGFTSVYAKAEKKLELNIIKGTFGRKKLPFNNFNMEYRLSIKNIYTHQNFAFALNYILHHKRDILFIPVSEISIGQQIYDLCKELKFDPVLWHSGCITSEHELNSYADIKEYVKSNNIDVLITTRVAFLGIDIDRISDILLFIGTQYSSIIQPIGRCFRNDHPACWLLEEIGSVYYNDEDHPINPIYRSCHFKRLNHIRKAYPNLETKYIPWSEITSFSNN